MSGYDEPKLDTDDPVWRQDFPVSSAGEDEVTRREFVRYLVLASGGFAVGNVGVAIWSALRTVNPGEPRPVIAADQLAEGSAHIFKFPTNADPAILLRLPGGELRAYSQKCTHLGCVVYFVPEDSELACPCHEGFFDAATGGVISGPPQQALGQIAIEERDGVIWAIENLGHGSHA